jgi:nucleoside-diphosphate-sugar epimerase
MVARRDTVIVTGSSGFVGEALLSTLAPRPSK